MKDFYLSDREFLPSFDFKKYTKPIKAHFLRNIILRRIAKKENEVGTQEEVPQKSEIVAEEPIIEQQKQDGQLNLF